MIDCRKSKKWRKLLMAGLGLLSFASVALAKEAAVVGMGDNREAALDDAKRNAVEQIVGTMIDSRSMSEMAVVKLDEIYTKSRGFVKKITVLEEGPAGGAYRIKALIDVDTDPDAKLMDQLTMLMMLNDPRIAVVILRSSAGQGSYDEGAQSGHDTVIESAINDRLVDMGFSHVVDTAHIMQLQDTPLLTRIYNGREGLHTDGVDRAVEYLVLGESAIDAYNVAITDRVNGGSQETGLKTVRVNLTAKILNYSTGDMVGSFTVSGNGLENNQVRAVEIAAVKAGEAAAKKVEEKFRKFAAKSVSNGIQLTVNAADYQKVEQLADELRSLSGVQSIYIRSYNGSKALIELEATQKPHNVIRALRERTRLGVFVEEVTDKTALLAVS